MTENTRAVDISDISAARERRAARQAALCAGGDTVVSLLMNIPGPLKRSLLFDRAFFIGSAAVSRCAASLGWSITASESEDLFTGLEARWVIAAPAADIKRELCAVEEAHPLGRFWDIDVISGQRAVSRTDIGLPERGCMLCSAPGRACARSRAHSVEQLIAFMEKSISAYLDERAADDIAAKAAEALLCEVCVTPKPGLVDRANNGSHTDMDIFTFLKSAAALSTYFRDAAFCGIKTRDIPESRVLSMLRGRGMLAEQQMFAVTGGINTHKGAIFSLGIACLAMGRLAGTGDERDTDAILSLCGRIARGEYGVSKAVTHGSEAKRLYGAGGIRAEAAEGFPAVKNAALPTLQKSLEAGFSFNAAAVSALLELIASLNDTNMMTRVGAKTAVELSEAAAKISASPLSEKELLAKAAELDSLFIAKNASPGGCADMLALAILLWLRRQSSDSEG